MSPGQYLYTKCTPNVIEDFFACLCFNSKDSAGNETITVWNEWKV